MSRKAKFMMSKFTKRPKSFEPEYNYFKNDLKILQNLNRVLPQSVKKYERTKKAELGRRMQRLDSQGKRELRKFIMSLRFGRCSATVGHEDAARILAEDFDLFVFTNRSVMFIREMSLVYLITSYEQFLESALETTFMTRWETMLANRSEEQTERRIERQIPLRLIFESKNLESLKRSQIQERARSIVNRSDITNLGEYLRKILDMDMTERKDWKDFAERFYRRHLVVHNNCYPDESYCIKTGYKGERKRLDVSNEYLTASLNLFDQYADLLHRAFLKKFGSGRR